MGIPDPWRNTRRRTELVLSILRGHTTVEEAAEKHGLDVTQIVEWEELFLKGGQRALSSNLRFSDLRPFRDFPFRLALLALVGVWLAWRVIYWNGYYTEDAPGYVTDAVYAAVGNYHARDYNAGLNVGTYLPVALPLAVLGKTEVALTLWPLFCSLLGVASLTAAAAILFGRGFGLLAGLLYATYPGDVFFSTVVMPDAVQGGWLAFSIFLIVFAYAGPPDRKYRRLAAAGVAMGFCHLIRSNGALLLPVGVLGVMVFAKQWKREGVRAIARATLTYLAGWLSVQVVEGLVYLWAVGDFMHRMHVVDRHYGTLQSIGQWGLNTNPNTIPFSIFAPLLWWRQGGWWNFNQDQAYHGLIFCFALGGLIFGTLAFVFTRLSVPGQTIAGFSVGAFWFVWPLLYHQFGSQSLTQFVPIHRLSRHLVVYAPGAVFATVAACALIAVAEPSCRVTLARWRFAALALGVLLLHLSLNWTAERVAFHSFHDIKATYVRIRDHLPTDVRTLIGDPGDLCFFDFWLNPLGVERIRIVPFANYQRCDEFTQGVLLTWSNPGWVGLSAPVIQDTVARLPCLRNPPANWRLLYDGFPEKVFVLGQSGTQ
jgi:Dolichyl-phosphate-mannose-protein mannosyltransferase